MKSRKLLDNLINTILIGSAHLECPEIAAGTDVKLDRDRFLTILKMMALEIAEEYQGETDETLATRITDFAEIFYGALALGNFLDSLEVKV